MKKNLSMARISALLLFLAVLMMAVPSAAAGEGKAYAPITSIDLGVKELKLEVGETYQFKVTYKPADPAFTSLKWYVTDESVIEIDPLNFTVTALKPGSTRILAESLDEVSSTSCDITVNGTLPKDAAITKSGGAFLNLSEADREKISAKSLTRYLDFIEASNFTEASYKKAAKREFSVTADVVPGTESAESKRAYALGMKDAAPLKNLHAVALLGTLKQILAFTADNDDLIEIFGGDLKYISDPIYDEDDEGTAAKSMDLDGNTEKLTSISTAHKLGYNGKGQTIAIIDTGLNPRHPEFRGRVVKQRCFSTRSGNIYSVCSSKTSAKPANAKSKSAFSHGSHVTGIAAGKHGIAPKAKIIAIQAFSEQRWTCSSSDAQYYACDNYRTTGKCCAATILTNDELKSYNYLISLVNKGTKIASVNMSYGFGSYSTTTACVNENRKGYEALRKLYHQDIDLVASSGNDGSNKKLDYPSCLPVVWKVGALADLPKPRIAPYSNHQKMIDILAPGTYIYSANYPKGYTYKSGTSMASPMVAGGAAVFKQKHPDQTGIVPSLVSMTTVRVNKRSSDLDYDDGSGRRFRYSKPVLNFANIDSW